MLTGQQIAFQMNSDETVFKLPIMDWLLQIYFSNVDI